MKEFFNKFFFSRKISSRLLLAGMLILGVYLFRDHLSMNSKFRIQTKNQQILNVIENGRITYTSGRIIDIKNEFSTEEKINRNESVVTVHGRIDGNIDPVLSPLFNSRNYFTEIDLSDIESACSPRFNPLYPSALRRLIYFMPEAGVFDGQVWEINTCDGKFNCSYTLKYPDKKASVELLCSGSIEGSEVALSGNLEVNKKLNGFDSVRLEITSSSPELVSNWVFNDIKK